jgi:hypothetical protein
LQNGSVDIGRQDREILAVGPVHEIGEHHGQGIGLHAGRGGRAPAPDKRSALRAQGGQDRPRKVIEMPGSRKKSVLLVVTALMKAVTASSSTPIERMWSQ